MQRIPSWMHLWLFVALSAVLVGCEIVITGPIGLPPDFRISSASYQTDYSAFVDGVERNVICDDRDTILTYSFNYSGTLDYWTSYLQGVDSGEIAGRVTFTPNDNGVTYTSSSVSVRYIIRPYAAPLLVGPEGVSSEAIVPVPAPRVIGESVLLLNINGYSRGYQLISRPIPVVSNCP